MHDLFTYNDLITGKSVILRVKKKFRDSSEKWLILGKYKPSLNPLFKCETCKSRVLNTKCDIVGISNSDCSNIKLDYVCTFWKPKNMDRKESARLSKLFKKEN